MGEEEKVEVDVSDSESEPITNTQQALKMVCDMEDERGGGGGWGGGGGGVSYSETELGGSEGELNKQYVVQCNSRDAYQISCNFEGVIDSQLSDVGSIEIIPEAKRIRLDNQKGYGKKLDKNKQNDVDNRSQPLEPEK